MIQNEEIKKLKLEIEFLKNQIYILSINIENTIKNIAFAVDKQDQKIIKFNIWN